jgi:large conductance mechanosensitive channel
MKIIDEFKAFALKGNLVDVAVGIIIGLAFGKVVTSVVNDIIMPPIGLILGGVDFTDLMVVLKKGTETVPPVTWNYGAFIQNCIDFLIVAFAVFMLVKGMNAARRKKEEAPAPPPHTKEELLLTEIRDLLKK